MPGRATAKMRFIYGALSDAASTGAMRSILRSVALFEYGGSFSESEKKIIAQKEKPPAKLQVAYLRRMKQSAI